MDQGPAEPVAAAEDAGSSAAASLATGSAQLGKDVTSAVVKGTVKGSIAGTKAAAKGTVNVLVPGAATVTKAVVKGTVKGTVATTKVTAKVTAKGMGMAADQAGIDTGKMSKIGTMGKAGMSVGRGAAALAGSAGKYTLRMLQDNPDMEEDENGFLIPDLDLEDLMGEVYAHSENEMTHKADVECEAAAIVADNLMAALLNQFETSIEQWDLLLELCNWGMNTQNHNEEIMEHMEAINEMKYDVYITSAQRVDEFLEDMRECENEMIDAQHHHGVEGMKLIQHAKDKKRELLLATKNEFINYEEGYLKKLNSEIATLQGRHPLADYFLDYWKNHDRMCGCVYNTLMDLDKQIDKEIERMPLQVLCEYRRELTTEAFSHGVGRMPDFDVPSMIASHTFLHCPDHDDAFWTYRVDEETWRHAHDDVPIKPADGEKIFDLHLPPDPHNGTPEEHLCALIEDKLVPASLGSDGHYFRSEKNLAELESLRKELAGKNFKDLKARAQHWGLAPEEIWSAESRQDGVVKKAFGKVNFLKKSADKLQNEEIEFHHLTGWVQMPDIEDNYVDLFATVSDEDLIFWEKDTYLTHEDPVLVLKLGELTGVALTADRADLEVMDPLTNRPRGVTEDGEIVKSVIKLVTEYATWRIKFNPAFPEVAKIWWKELCGARKWAIRTDGADTVYARHFNRRLFPRNGQADVPGEMPIWKKVEGMALATKDSSGSALKSSSISILRGTDVVAGKLFAGSAGATKLLVKGSLQATKATAKGTLAGGYLLTKQTVDKSILYAPSVMSASVEGARQARKLMKLTGQGGEAATMATLELANMGTEQVLKGTGFLLKKTLQSAASVAVLTTHAAAEAAKQTANVAGAGLDVAGAGLNAGLDVAKDAQGAAHESKEDRALAKQRKKAEKAAAEADGHQDMQNRVITREFERQVGVENQDALDKEAARQQAIREADEAAGWDFQAKRDRLQEIKKMGKKEKLGNLIPNFTDAELGALTSKEQLIYKKAQLTAKKEARGNAEAAAAALEANTQPLDAVPEESPAAEAAPIAEAAPEGPAVPLTPKEQKKADLAAKKAALEQKKADRKAGKKKGGKGKNADAAVANATPPEGPAPDGAESGEPAKPMTEKEKKKAELAAKKAALEAKKAARKKGGKKAAPAGPVSEGALGDAAAAEMAMDAALEAAAAESAAAALAAAPETPMTPKEKKKAELAAKKAALEAKKAERKAGKKGGKKSSQVAPATPAEVPEVQAASQDAPEPPVLDAPPAAVSTAEAAAALGVPDTPMTPKEKKKAELAAKKAALEQKKLDRKQGGKKKGGKKAAEESPAETPAVSTVDAPAPAADAPAPTADAPVPAADVPAPAAGAPVPPGMSPKEKKKAELAAKKVRFHTLAHCRVDYASLCSELTPTLHAQAALEAKKAEKEAKKKAKKGGKAASEPAPEAVPGEEAAAAEPADAAAEVPAEPAAPMTPKEKKKAELAAKKVRIMRLRVTMLCFQSFHQLRDCLA
jgi:hypothetical protein